VGADALRAPLKTGAWSIAVHASVGADALLAPLNAAGMGRA